MTYAEYMTQHFDAAKIKNEIVLWIREWFKKNGDGCNAVVGISGGKDSSIVAALCVEALGKERVIGVLMPNHSQSDIGEAYQLCDFLDIRHTVLNIGHAIDDITKEINSSLVRRAVNCTGTLRNSSNFSLNMSEQATVNLPCRIRMSTLYAVSQSVNGRVANTCNLSEDWIGYSTRYGDSVGDFSPLSCLTVAEVKAIGHAIGLPPELVDKVPTDGLCSKTDEDNFGFTYDVLDKYIRTGVCADVDVKKKIDSLHEKNKFKLEPMPVYYYPGLTPTK